MSIGYLLEGNKGYQNVYLVEAVSGLGQTEAGNETLCT